MNIFSKLGYYIVSAFNLVGMLILAIPKIPEKLRNFDSNNIKERIDTENLKGNISNLRDDIGLDEKISQISNTENLTKTIKKTVNREQESDSEVVMIGGAFTSEEKERTILTLQLLSAAFVVISILSIFHFVDSIIYIPIGVVLV